MKQLTFDLTENKTEVIRLRIQPSLKAIFEERCAAVSTGPVDPSDLMRRLIVKWVQETKQGDLF